MERFVDLRVPPHSARNKTVHSGATELGERSLELPVHADPLPRWPVCARM